MFKQSPTGSRTRWLAMVMVLALGWSVALAEVATVASGDSDTDSLTAILSLPRLAERGAFDQVHRAVLAQGDADDEHVKKLLGDLELYARHAADWDAQRQKAYDAAIDEMKSHMEEGATQKALYSAIEASALAKDQARMLQTGPVVSLVQQAEKEIAAATKNGQWIDKMALYRSLDFLFDRTGQYRDRAQEAERRLSLIRFYAPDAYVKLLTERAKRLEDEDFEPPKLDNTTWGERLEGVELSMLRQALAHAARLHVTRPGYAPLINSGIEQLLLLARTEALQEIFPGLADAQANTAFRTDLEEIRAEANKGGASLNFLDAADMVDRIIRANRSSVKLPSSVLLYELGNGAMFALDDFSNIIWPHDLKQFNRHLQGSFFGVGIQIEKRDGRLTVVSPLEGTPAHRAGIKASDVIATVDGKDTSDWSLDRAVTEITGPEGSEVVLGIERKGVKDLIPMTVRRARIEIRSVRGWERKSGGGWEHVIDPTFRIGYIRISQFIPQTDTDMVRTILLMQRSGGMNGLVLDLRSNPGGLLSSAIDVADRFIESGAVVSTSGPDEDKNRSFNAHRERTLGKFPLVILTNEGSASASEIVSGALQDYGRAIIVGKRTFGKGSVQDPFAIDGAKARLKLTTQYYKLPRGRIIHRTPGDAEWGIEPDLTVNVTPKQLGDLSEMRSNIDILRDKEDGSAPENGEAKLTADDILRKGMDPQLEAALLVLKTRLISRDLAIAHMQKNNAPATP